jgi:hypothetical protein
VVSRSGYQVEFAVPWEISIISGTVEDPKPLGSREDVIVAFAESLPGVLLQRRPALPPEILDQMPPFARDAMMRPSLEADFEMDDLSIRFHANDEPCLQWVNGEVRGNGDPIPLLAALCLGRGWSVMDASNKSIVNLSLATGSSGWQRFQKWRDEVILEAQRADKL